MGEDRVTQTETGKGLERSYILKKECHISKFSTMNPCHKFVRYFFLFLNPLDVQVQLSKVLLMAIKYTQKIANI